MAGQDHVDQEDREAEYVEQSPECLLLLFGFSREAVAEVFPHGKLFQLFIDVRDHLAQVAVGEISVKGDNPRLVLARDLQRARAGNGLGHVREYDVLAQVAGDGKLHELVYGHRLRVFELDRDRVFLAVLPVVAGRGTSQGRLYEVRDGDDADHGIRGPVAVDDDELLDGRGLVGEVDVGNSGNVFHDLLHGLREPVGLDHVVAPQLHLEPIASGAPRQEGLVGPEPYCRSREILELGPHRIHDVENRALPLVDGLELHRYLGGVAAPVGSEAS